jgi:protein-tyrosine phosphatase
LFFLLKEIIVSSISHVAVTSSDVGRSADSIGAKDCCCPCDLSACLERIFGGSEARSPTTIAPSRIHVSPSHGAEKEDLIDDAAGIGKEEPEKVLTGEIEKVEEAARRTIEREPLSSTGAAPPLVPTSSMNPTHASLATSPETTLPRRPKRSRKPPEPKGATAEKTERIPMLSREEAKKRIFDKFPDLERDIAILRREISLSKDDGLSVHEMAERVRGEIGFSFAEKMPKEADIEVIIGSGKPGEPGLFLGADCVPLRRGEARFPLHNLSIVKANEDNRVFTYPRPDLFHEVLCPATKETGLITWEDLCEVSSIEMEPRGPEGGAAGGGGAREKLWRLLHAFDNGLLREGSEGVLAHCSLGVDRSACLVLIYLINRLGLSFEEALVYLIAKRQKADPKIIFHEIRSYSLECTSLS